MEWASLGGGSELVNHEWYPRAQPPVLGALRSFAFLAESLTSVTIGVVYVNSSRPMRDGTGTSGWYYNCYYYYYFY